MQSKHRVSRGPRAVVGLAGAGTLVLALSACGGGSVNGNESGGEGGATEISVWWTYTDTSATKAQELVDRFNESQDEYVVTGQFGAPSDQFTSKLINAVKTDTAPNLVLGDGTPQNLGQLIDTGAVVPLDDLLDDPSSSLSRENITEGMLSTGIFDGEQYSIPTDAGNYAMVYNKAMFEEAGITETPETWAELADVAAKLTDGTSRYGIYLPISSGEWPVFTWQSTLWSAGGEFLNEDNTEVLFNSDEGVAALTAWTDLIESGSAYPQTLFSNTNNGGTAALTAGKVAIAYDGAYNLATIDEALGEENVGVFAVPGIDEPAMNLGTDNSYILEGSEEEQAGAWEFLQYWMSPSVQAEWDIASGYFPTNTATSEDETWQAYLEENPRIDVFVSQLPYAQARPSITTYAEISNALSEQLTRAMMGSASPKEALDAAAEKAQSILDAAE
ncbi:ABC transporter substrate-binding protein [Microbacterium oryzae]|uniref:ABC transporter substrate-binding protein n=1 Tax=Microbacterium oryzae TaxID=743009 RepID=UPI0025B1B60F|nr:ABC transporter substrate-binding protein [Microbacterium oryzae]MDN3311706.1 ABC transporter substrate-binding protein [Microbacterium oryzae]